MEKMRQEILTLLKSLLKNLNNEKVMGWIMGLEPITLGSTNQCSNQLSYTHHYEFLPGTINHYICKNYGAPGVT